MKQKHELITRIANGQTVIPRHLLDQACHPNQCLVADLVAIPVIDPLKIIHIHHEEGERTLFQGVPFDFGLKVLVEETSIVDAGEFILEDEA